MKKNVNGSVMIWAIAVIMIFSIFSALALSISYSMVKRSTNENTLRQLSLSSKSATLIVSNAICNDPELAKDIFDNAPDTISANDIFYAYDNMHRCDVKAKYYDNKIIVSSTSTQDDLSYTYSAVIKKLGESSWAIVSYDNYDIDYLRSEGE